MDKKKNLTMPVGVILLALAIIIEQFVPSSNISNFFIGLFIGLSIVLNIYYLIIVSKARKKEVHQ